MNSKCHKRANKTEKILIIVKDGKQQRTLEEFLGKAHYKNITIFPDTQYVLSYLNSKEADLILFEAFNSESEQDFIRELKAHKTANSIPVVALIDNAKSNTSFKKQLVNDGVDDYLDMPLTELDVIFKVNSLVHKRSLHKQLADANQRMGVELANAQDMLVSLLPKEDELDSIKQKYGVDIGVYFKPSSELGGDFYDFKDTENEKMIFYLWDFSGHGITSAINTFRLHTIIKDSIMLDLSPGEMLTSLNDATHRLLELKHYATMFAGSLSFRNRKLTYSAAACPSPLVLFKGGKSLAEISCREFPLGIKQNHVYQSYEQDLKDAKLLVLYSDALIETPDKSGSMLSIDDLNSDIMRLYSDLPTASAKVLVNNFMKEFMASRGKFLSDDLTLCIVKL